MNVRPFRKSFGIDFRHVLIFICLVYFSLGVYAIFQIPLVGDEPEDFFIALDTVSKSRDFFQNIYAADQARLSHLISYPFIALLREKALIPLRILFFLFYFVYIWISYRLLIFVTENRNAGFVYGFLIATSLFLHSFSIFSMTTGGSLFLLFHISSIYFFCKGYLEQRKTGTFFPLMPFVLCLGFCIASKLFGLFLAGALFLYHLLDRRTSGVVTGRTFIRLLQVLSLFFILFVFMLNFLNIAPVAKSSLAVVLSLAYFTFVLYLTEREKKSDQKPIRISKFQFWLTTGLVAFNLTLCFSPIYFNLENLLWPFGWFRNWNQGQVTMFASAYDIPVILILKYGLLSSLVLFVSFFIFLYRCVRKRDQGWKHWFFSLITFIFLVHFSIISLVHFKGPWYPLAIFPFLYLPFVWMWLRVEQNGSKTEIIFALICLFLVAGDNLYRYIKWYPYGHLDGAQYGKKFIGWDKPGYVTFEAMPLVYSALSRSLPLKSSVRVNCQFTPVMRFNRYSTSTLRDYFRSKKDDKHFDFFVGAEEDDTDLLLTSPLFHPSFNEKLAQDKQYERLSTITIKGLEMVSIWRKKYNG